MLCVILVLVFQSCLIVYDILKLAPLENCDLDVHFADSSMKKPLGKIDDVLIMVNNNLVPVDFVVLDIECNPSCPIVLEGLF